MGNEIIKYIEEQLLNIKGDTKIGIDEDLLTSGLLDSLSIMKLIQFIENTFDVKIPPEDMTIEHFISVEAMEEYIKTNQIE